MYNSWGRQKRKQQGGAKEVLEVQGEGQGKASKGHFEALSGGQKERTTLTSFLSGKDPFTRKQERWGLLLL